MGDPFSSLLLGGVAILGSGLQAYGAHAQGVAAQRAADYNAELDLAQGREEAKRIRRIGERNIAKTRVNVSKAGVAMSGSVLLAIDEAIQVNERDALQTEQNARNSANLLRYQGRAAKHAGNIGATASLIQSGSSLFSSFSSGLNAGTST